MGIFFWRRVVDFQKKKIKRNCVSQTLIQRNNLGELTLTLFVSETKSLKMAEALEELSMEELLAIRAQVGAKEFAEKVTKPKIRAMKRKMNPDYEPKEKQKRENIVEKLVKNAPEEISSKKKPPKLRQVVAVPKDKITDPRFMSDVTEFSQVAFDKRFKFLADMEQNEKKILSKKLRKVKDKELKGNIHKLINRIDQRAESRKERADIRSAQTEWKRQERQKQIEQGNKPFFRRQSDIV